MHLNMISGQKHASHDTISYIIACSIGTQRRAVYS